MGALRVVAALLFLGAAPGLAWARLLDLPQGSFRVAVVVALSLAADTLVATTLFYAGVWSAGLALAILVGVCGAGLAVGRRHPPAWARWPGGPS